MMVQAVVVIGAGIIGLSAALKIKEKYPDFRVVLISDKLTPHTTGDGSGGLWLPYLSGNTPANSLSRWGAETYHFYHKQWLNGDVQIALMPMFKLNTKPTGKALETPQWAKEIFGFHHLTSKELEHLSRRYSSNFVEGQYFTTFIAPPRVLLAYLQQRFLVAGGVIQMAKVHSLYDQILKNADVVVNCTGLGAREIVPDLTVYPIRGQISKVKANWINETIIDEDNDIYVIPNFESTVLGGTHQENDYNTTPTKADHDRIVKGCKDLYPGLEHAENIEDWAGLRPGRDNIRLDCEVIDGKLIIHNYGHGGSGLTLFWGCATHVVELLDNFLKSSFNAKKISKL